MPKISAGLLMHRITEGMSRRLPRRISIGLAAVGPGLFLIGYNIGTGSVTTMAKSGAEHGMSLFWALVLSCVFTYVLMAICFLIVFFLVKPSVTAVLSGLIPRIPKGPGAFGLVAAMAGTTSSAAVFVMRSIVVAEKGWTAAELHGEKRDAAVSAGMMVLLSGVIMAVSAGTPHVMGLRLNDSVEMVRLFEPLGGRIASYILILGIAGAGLSTVFPIILIAPWRWRRWRRTSCPSCSRSSQATTIWPVRRRQPAP